MVVEESAKRILAPARLWLRRTTADRLGGFDELDLALPGARLSF